MIVERSVRGRRVFAECLDAHARMAASTLGVFERLASAGEPPAPETQVRFGWSLLRLADDGDGLRVTEPDFARWPERHWAPTIDATLRVLAAQTGLLRHLDVDGDDAYFDQAIVAAPGALDRPNVFLHRTSSGSAEDSGWLLGAADAPESLAREGGLEAMPIASLVVRRPALLGALALPPGFVALFSGDTLEQVFDAAGRPRLSARA